MIKMEVEELEKGRILLACSYGNEVTTIILILRQLRLVWHKDKLTHLTCGAEIRARESWYAKKRTRETG